MPNIFRNLWQRNQPLKTQAEDGLTQLRWSAHGAPTGKETRPITITVVPRPRMLSGSSGATGRCAFSVIHTSLAQNGPIADKAVGLLLLRAQAGLEVLSFFHDRTEREPERRVAK